MAMVLEGCELAFSSFQKCNSTIIWTFISKTCAALHMPVYGDIFQEFVGQAVMQDDSLRGNFESNLLRLLPTGFSLLQRQNRSLRAC